MEAVLIVLAIVAGIWQFYVMLWGLIVSARDPNARVKVGLLSGIICTALVIAIVLI